MTDNEERKRHLHLVGEEIAEQYLVSCEICGNNTSSASKRCNACWQCEHRLEEYLKHKAGRDNVADIILRLEADRL